jgi:sugar phosphate isomerase/epimerase
MKIGVKTFDDENFLKFFENKVDFFEIMTVQGNDYSFLKNLYLPIVIHAEHQGFGMNPADYTKRKQNLKSVNFAREIADLTQAKKIIVHPGEIEKGNENCSLENAVDFFNELNDERIIVENLPSKLNLTRLCENPEDIKEFMKRTKTGFCFDINHSINNLIILDKDYSFIKEYLQLRPIHYHIGGQSFDDYEAHYCLNDSDLDLKKILSYYPNNAEITLETEVDLEKTEEDIRIIKKVIQELKN